MICVKIEFGGHRTFGNLLRGVELFRISLRMRQVFTARLEANDNMKYLRTLEDWFDKLNDDGDFPKLLEVRIPSPRTGCGASLIDQKQCCQGHRCLLCCYCGQPSIV